MKKFHHLDTVISPSITEKSTSLSELNKIVFKVHKDASKNSKSKIIKSARNIPNLKIIDQEGANVYDLLKYKNVVFTTSSIKSFQDRVTK